MKLRRHMPPLKDWHLHFRFPRLRRLPPITQDQALRWAFWLGVAAVAGYLIAALLVFPAPIFPHHQQVPRVLGLPLDEAQRILTASRLGTIDNGSATHPSAAAGTVIWQDPPPGVEAPANLKVALVTSAGPPRVPVPDVIGLNAALATRLISAAGLMVSRVESVQAAAPTGQTMLTRPAAATALVPGSGVGLVVSRGAPTITVPDLLGLSPADARARLEAAGLAIGGLTRQRTANVAPGTVVAQRPAAGTLAAPGTLVDVVVARSPQ
ncbi:MAG TPA: PASTA domain-containing protein [Gemmatimonadales bacterium]